MCSAGGDLVRALDAFFESGGEMPEGGGAVAGNDDDDDDEDMDDGLDEEELARAEAGAGAGTSPFSAVASATRADP